MHIQGKDIDNITNKNNKMNFPLIYTFLKMTKSLLIVNNLNSCYPYNYNVDKFKTIEYINIIANIVFKTQFIPEQYLDKIKKFNSKKPENNLNSENIIREG
jgi:hypothetical protein